MLTKAIYAPPYAAEKGAVLAGAVDLPFIPLEHHRFPDGEIRVRAYPPAAAAVLFAPLHRPDDKLAALLFAAAALRDQGSRHITLIAPYLCYMRQDTAFREGEAVSQRVIGKILADHFDHIIAVEPHLHRTASLGAVFPGIHATAVAGAPALIDLLRRETVADSTLLVGPDSEARPWVEAVAGPLGLDCLTADKTRHGDLSVQITLPQNAVIRGRRVILVDDMVSTGGTLARTATLLRSAGASGVEAMVVHALCSDSDMARLRDAGIDRLRSCDTVPHSSNAASIIPVLVDILRKTGANDQTGGEDDRNR